MLAKDVQLLPADSGPTDFVRLAGALIGSALSAHFGPGTLPEITERITTPDGGVDARFIAPPRPDVPESSGLVGPGTTVFQFKYRDPTRAPRDHLVREVIRAVGQEFPNVAPICDRYVLLTNLDLSHRDRDLLRRALTRSTPVADDRTIVIWGAAELATAINLTPHLRHLFFAEGGLCTLDVAEVELRAAWSSVGWPSFIGRGPQRAAIEDFLRDPGRRLLQVVGPRYVGKTRLVIEALREHAARVLWWSHADATSLDRLRDLDDADDGIVLVVDDCAPGAVRPLLEIAEARRHLKTIVIRDGVGQDVGPGMLRATPFDDEDIDRIVGAALPGAPWREQSWLQQATGGLPGVILHVAALLKQARISTSTPSADIRRRLGDLVEQNYLLPLDSQGRQALSVAALLPMLGVDGEAGKEADAVSASQGLNPNTFRSRLPELESLGFVRRRGRFIEVTPPVLADHLADRALRRPEPVLAELSLALDENAFCRFLERFRDLPNAEIRQAIERVLSPDGWFDHVMSLVSGARRLEIVTPAAPLAALRCLERLLGPLDVETLRRTIHGDARFAIVETAKNLALRSATFGGAAGLLLALAEASTGSGLDDRNNTFIELFHWQHPEVAATFAQRRAILEAHAAAGSDEQKTLIARACGSAFGDLTVGLHQADRASLPEPPYRPETWGEVRQYAESVLEVLIRLRGDESPRVRDAAFVAFLRLFRACIRLSHAPEGLSDLGRRAFDEVEKLGRSAVNARERVKVVETLEFVPDEGSTNGGGTVSRVDAVERRDRLLRMLTEEDLRSRLWRWVGPLSGGLERLAFDEPAVGQRAIHALASDLTKSPTDFAEHLAWLTSDEAEDRFRLFFTLGVRDHDRKLLESLLAHHEGAGWPRAFGGYVSGWSTVAASQADALLDQLADSRPELHAGVLHATASSLPASTAGVDRILRLAVSTAHPRAMILRDLAVLRWDELAAADFERLVRGLDDGTAETRYLLLWPFLSRLVGRASLSPRARDLAWSFLEAAIATPEARRGRWWDLVAAELGKPDPARLLALVEDAVARDASGLRSLALTGLADAWPLAWKVLTTCERAGLVRMLLQAAVESDLPPWGALVLQATLRPDEDTELLLRFADDGDAKAARTVAGVLDASRPGFWQVARRLLATWGADEMVSDRLLSPVLSGSYDGSAVPMVTERLTCARALLSDANPHVVRWARQAVESLEGWKRRAEREDSEEWIWDTRIRRAELEGMLKKRGSSERLWAVARLLEDAPEARVRELLAPDEILEALPRLSQLDERSRRKWEGWARHWSGRHE